jgi:uncharacterized damage-inducible protein DinB
MSEIDPRYPLGRFQPPAHVDPALRASFVTQIAGLPNAMRAAVAGLDPAQLDTPYRDGGWTVRQVVHHVPDSHLNAYVRFKLALTEDGPTIRTYDQVRWAETSEARHGDVEPSLALLDGLHARWVAAIRATPAEALARTFVHPEMGPFTLDRLLALYAWHGRHHVAHITSLREREGWR